MRNGHVTKQPNFQNYQQQQQQYYSQQQQYHHQHAESHSVILVTAGYDHTIRFWEALNGICSRTIQHPESQVNRLCISPDKRFLAAAGNHHVRLYDINSTNPNPVLDRILYIHSMLKFFWFSSILEFIITSFGDHTGNVTAVGFHAEGRWMVTGSEDGQLKIWDTRGPAISRNFDHGAPINDVAIHPNQGELISCDQNGSIKVWDLSANECTHEWVPEEDVPIRSVTVASDGSMLVAANNKGNCFVWKMSNTSDFTDLKPITRFTAHNKYITRCLLSPDTKLLSFGKHGDYLLQFLYTTACRSRGVWIDQQSMHDVADTLQPFELEKEPEKTLVGHQRWVWDCAFSADSAYLVTGRISSECNNSYRFPSRRSYFFACHPQPHPIMSRAYGNWPRARRYDSTMGTIRRLCVLR
ncbi:LOW QUALITY PROTEIN: WD40-repeat-containing domain protein [Endogone sp. FLAS-F59071]|nr:LOW QUALITY PROTEIN: WD40-repeat-containing domain protein [Endogone sp. FLAS-F59071]|eukprot:RUS23215.1 LOW QUALITY PROTEIN: WD40-repeat-containing domain protein [Endogone sp. FLAS-F59071]